MSKNKNTTRFVSLRKTIKDDAVLLFRAFFHKKTPISVKVLTILMIIYIVSPIDVIPDFLPVIWIVDDFTIIAICVTLIKKLIPDLLQDELNGKILIGK